MKNAFIAIGFVLLLIIGVIIYREARIIRKFGNTKKKNNSGEDLIKQDEDILQDGPPTEIIQDHARPIFKNMEPIRKA